MNTIHKEIAEWVESDYGSCPVSGTSLLAFLDSQQAEIDTLKAERDAAMKDAERYRWLRHGDNDEKVLCQGPIDMSYWYLLRNEKLDAAIDAAIAKAEGGAA